MEGGKLFLVWSHPRKNLVWWLFCLWKFTIGSCSEVSFSLACFKRAFKEELDAASWKHAHEPSKQKGNGAPVFLLNLEFEVDICCIQASAFVKPNVLCVCLFSSWHPSQFAGPLAQSKLHLCNLCKAVYSCNHFLHYEMYYPKVCVFARDWDEGIQRRILLQFTGE